MVLSVRLFGVVTQPQVPVSSGAALQLPQAIPAGQAASELSRNESRELKLTIRFALAFTAPGIGWGTDGHVGRCT